MRLDPIIIKRASISFLKYNGAWEFKWEHKHVSHLLCFRSICPKILNPNLKLPLTGQGILHFLEGKENELKLSIHSILQLV